MRRYCLHCHSLGQCWADDAWVGSTGQTGSLPSSQSSVYLCVCVYVNRLQFLALWEIIRIKAQVMAVSAFIAGCSFFLILFESPSLYLFLLPGSALLLWSGSSYNKAPGSTVHESRKSPNYSVCVRVCLSAHTPKHKVYIYVYTYFNYVLNIFSLVSNTWQISPQGLILHAAVFFFFFLKCSLYFYYKRVS